MTPGGGFDAWQRIGSFERELKPYVAYTRQGWRVKILTFDRGALPRLPEGIEAVRFPHYRLLPLLPWLFRKLGAWADVIKTNQSYRAGVYTRAAQIWRAPILLRCGYVYGEYLETTEGLTPAVRRYQQREARAFRAADHCQVPTDALAAWIQRRYRLDPARIAVIPNFVETDLFTPLSDVPRQPRAVISVGRLAPVKRFDWLIRACAAIPSCTLTLVGDGPEHAALQQLAAALNLRLHLPGNVPHAALPRILQQHQVFAITSQREGHPKSLIEAMACGLPCVGVNADGIRNVLEHGATGWLVEPAVDAIRDGIAAVLGSQVVGARLGAAAREFAIARFQFDTAMTNEIALCTKLAGQNSSSTSPLRRCLNR